MVCISSSLPRRSQSQNTDRRGFYGITHNLLKLLGFIDEIASIVALIAGRHNITAVYLFGSRATGKNDFDSDYDFILDTTDEFSFLDYCEFTDELSIALGRLVDIVDRSCL